MAHSLSAKKRVRQNASSRSRNKWRKTQFRTAIKSYREAVLHGTVEESETQLKGLYKLLDQVAAAGALHKNTASRYKSRLSTLLNRKRAPKAAAAA